jgi:GntR family transcriptional regulator of vanillate catabolism
MDPIEPPAPEAASVVAALRQRIVDGRYPPGTRLAEIPVADALGVSRTPVRLAFRTLEQEGLLEKTGKRGLVVRAFTRPTCCARSRCAVRWRAWPRAAWPKRGMPPGLLCHAAAAAWPTENRMLAKGRLAEGDIARLVTPEPASSMTPSSAAPAAV